MSIDVVVPIYNAYTEVVNCLESLQKHQSKAQNILIINDASTDKRIDDYLVKITKKNNWTLIQHEKNLGFVKTANQGLKTSQNHTILLNSDTIVSQNWLEAFNLVAESVENLGTATAWSNNAEICSFPNFLQNNNPPNNINELSEILFNNYKCKYPEIPTAVGFCMLITKKAKELVGFFDEKQFGHGYGEENDYSLRVKAHGLTNVLCDNAYVVHVGNASFSDFGLQPNENTMKRLLDKHPEYLQEIQKYIKNDSLKAIRKEILALVNNHNQKLYQQIKSGNE